MPAASTRPSGECCSSAQDLLVRERPVLDPAPDLVGEFLRHDALAAQRPEPFERDGHGHDGAQDDRHHDDAAGFHDFEHFAGRPCRKCPRIILHAPSGRAMERPARFNSATAARIARRRRVRAAAPRSGRPPAARIRLHRSARSPGRGSPPAPTPRRPRARENPSDCDARRRSGPSAAGWRRRARDGRRATAMMRHDEQVDRSRRCRAQQFAFAVELRCRRSAAPCARPRECCSTQERSLSRSWRAGSGMQPFELDAVPGPASASRAADYAGGAERPAAGRACVYREARDEAGRAARVIRVVVTYDKQIDGAHASSAKVWRDREQRCIRAAAERRTRVVHQHVVARLDDHRRAPAPRRASRCAQRTPAAMLDASRPRRQARCRQLPGPARAAARARRCVATMSVHHRASGSPATFQTAQDHERRNVDQRPGRLDQPRDAVQQRRAERLGRHGQRRSDQHRGTMTSV